MSVLDGLVKNKFLILAAFLGEGRLSNWIESVDNPALKFELVKTLKTFEGDFKGCLDEINNTHRLVGQASIYNQFYMAFMGVPLSQAEHQPAMRRQDSIAPQPALISVRFNLDKKMQATVVQSSEVQNRAVQPMRDLFKSYPTLLEFLKEKMTALDAVNAQYNSFMLSEYERLQAEFQRARAQLCPIVEVKTATPSPDTQPEDASPPPAAASAAVDVSFWQRQLDAAKPVPLGSGYQQSEVGAVKPSLRRHGTAPYPAQANNWGKLSRRRQEALCAKEEDRLVLRRSATVP